MGRFGMGFVFDPAFPFASRSFCYQHPLLNPHG